MPGKSSTERAALELQNSAVVALFERAGFEQIAPDILQPADVFLESSGEDIRARSYVFADPSGAEVCLRPDLTVPACRYHLSHAEKPEAEARYCYCGPAFRYPGEFTQAGLEWYAAADPQQAEARILKLALAAVEAAGLAKYKVTLGDLSLFTALLDDMAMPARWRQRLKHHFWRPQAFRELLDAYAAPRAALRTSISGFVDAVAGGDAMSAQERVGELLRERDLALIGGRDAAEIAERLVDKAADRSEPPLDARAVERLAAYLELDGDPLTIGLVLAGEAAHFAAARARFARRNEEFEEQHLNPRRYRFQAAFGRELEYYTGFVFQIEAETARGPVVVAGGGRYDDLLAEIGSPVPVTAVGCAIHTDRLLAAIRSA